VKENCLGEIEEFVSMEEKENRFGVLSSLGVPIHERIISLVLKEIMKLVREHPKRGINTFENWRGNQQSVIVIPQFKNE